MPVPDLAVLPRVVLLRREVLAAGVTEGKLRGPGWRRLGHALYVPAGVEPDLPARASGVVGLVPTASGFGHLTSAALRGWWLPNRVHYPAGLLLASTTGNLHVQRRGLYVRRSAYSEVEDVGGLPLMSPAQTLLELAQDLSLLDLVPIVDCALAGGATTEQLLGAARPRARGSLVLRRAVSLADPRSESWWESVLRVLHVVTDLGPVQSQVDLFDENGFVGRADLHLVGTSRYPECDGGEHRTRTRHGKDLRRDKAMHRMGADRYGYTTAEIEYQPQMIIRDAETARGLPHDPDRVSQWWRVARSSSLTGHGRARLQSRLRRYQLAAERPDRQAHRSPSP